MEFVDENNRVLLMIGNNGKVAFARYPDMTREQKDMIIGIALDICDIRPEELYDFLDYEDNNEDEFCS